MSRLALSGTALLVLAAAPVAAQLPMILAPPGTLRIEFGGVFSPATREYADGSLRDLGAPLNLPDRTVATSPLVADMAHRFEALTGVPSEGGSIGSLSADLAFQKGFGNIGLALGITSRLTGFANIPIVSIKTEALLRHDASGATLGLNPTLSGDETSATFLSGFEEAILALRGRIEAGDFLEDPELEERARAWFTDASLIHQSLGDLLTVEGRLSATLPLAGSADADALLGVVDAARQRFGDEFGITPFLGAPLFPTELLTTDQAAGLISSPEGFSLQSFDGQPLVGLGDVELGVAYQLYRSFDPGRSTWSAFWLIGSGTLATATSPRDNVLRDQGTGDRQSDLIFSGVGEHNAGAIGVRGELRLQIQQPTDLLRRVGGRDEFLRPVSRLAAVTWDPGDVLGLTVRPYYRLANHLAITGMISWYKRGEDSWAYVANATPASGGDPMTMGAGSASSLLRGGLGLSYSHDGRSREGDARMPVEAGLSLERSLSSGSGIGQYGLTTRLWFRVSKRIFSR